MIVWGWPFVGVMTLFVGLAMAEVCSSFPTAGGLYYWSAKLAPQATRPPGAGSPAGSTSSGQVAVTAGIDFGPRSSSTRCSTCSGFSTTRLAHDRAVRRDPGAARRAQPVRRPLVALLNNVSVWWHILGVLVIVGVLVFAPRTTSRSATCSPTSFNGTGWGSKIYVLLLGLLLAQYTFTGYDASAHMTEETQDAAVAARAASSCRSWSRCSPAGCC
jgi:hypothetical protein